MDVGAPFLQKQDFARFDFLVKKLLEEHTLLECMPLLIGVRAVVGSSLIFLGREPSDVR